MAYDFQEQEQLDALKAWWAKFGNLILGAITLVLLAVLAWQGWNWYLRSQSMQAAGYFEALQTATRQGEVSRVANASATLRDDFGRTAYAPRGALLAAQSLLDNGDPEAARGELAWVVEQGGDPALAVIARLRLAGVLLDLERYDEALAQLAGEPPAEYEALYADRRGDVHFARGAIDEARQAWQQAVDALAADSPLRGFVQLKIDALGGTAA